MSHLNHSAGKRGIVQRRSARINNRYSKEQMLHAYERINFLVLLGKITANISLEVRLKRNR